MKNNYFLRPEGDKIFMCCGKAKCPSVSFEGGNIIIKDDHNNSVAVKPEEALLITQASKDIMEIALGPTGPEGEEGQDEDS
jgi:hypothetical protein